MGRTLGFGLGQSHCEKNTRFWTGPVTLWEEHSVWTWAGRTVGRTLILGLDQSHCGKNTWFGTGPVTLWEEHRLGVSENEPGEDIKTSEGASEGDWIKLQSDKLHDFYCSPVNLQVTKFKMDEMCRSFGLYSGQKKCIQCFDGEIKRKVTSWNHGHRWEVELKLSLKEVIWGAHGVY